MTHGEAILFYDGVCGLCQRAVRFVLRHDRRESIRLAPLQSDLARSTTGGFGIDLPGGASEDDSTGAPAWETIYLWLREPDGRERLLDRSDAVIAILIRIGGAWSLLGRLIGLAPRALRDAIYRRIAANRYRWFGRHEQCPLPPPGLERRFAARTRR